MKFNNRDLNVFDTHVIRALCLIKKCMALTREFIQKSTFAMVGTMLIPKGKHHLLIEMNDSLSLAMEHQAIFF